MTTVVLVIHLLIALALVGTVLLQRSEGGALGIGGGGGGGGSLFSSRGAANMLTRTTAMLAVAFFVTSITLTMLARNAHGPSAFEGIAPVEGSGTSGGSALPKLPEAPVQPQVPSSN
ncbi:MAG: preprotein translocase subunit SecG [Aestuariivirgaceae bacterium]|nr:preprotein translocase subunit SecG [Aestuariivirgaceae bacterium]